MPSFLKILHSSSDTFANAANFVPNRRQSCTHRKLTRQGKLRHVTLRDLGLHLNALLNSPPASPSKNSRRWLSSPVPQPLPLPETPFTKRFESSGWNFKQALLGSPCELRGYSADPVVPKPAPCATKLHHRRLLYQDVSADGAKSSLRLDIGTRSAPTSSSSSPMVSPRRSNGGQSLYLNIEPVISKLSHIVSPRSAPTSGLSGPAVSPQRLNTADFLPSFMASQASPVRSDLEAGDSGRLTCQTSQVPPVKTVHTPDRSLFHCQPLQIPSPCPKNCNKLRSGNSKVPAESNIGMYRLPRPPEATPPQSSMPLPLPVFHQKEEYPNLSSRKPLWQKGKFIGRGTYGSVYLGTNRETGALCAIKEVKIIPDDRKSAECIKQLEQEIRLLQHLEHPNIVQYYGSERLDDRFYIYLEYVYPGPISRYVNEHSGVLTESIVRNFTRHILSGLAYLHSKKTIHRDIKGSNLLVNSSGVVKLADFGTAKHLSGLPYKLSLKGSPHWMSPEVIKAMMQNDGNPDLALAVDIWSLGCTIIEMFTGKPPWGGIQGAQAMFKALNGSPPIPEAISPEAKDFLQSCFRRNPAERPSASMLLNHAFMKSSSQHNLSTCRQLFYLQNKITDFQRMCCKKQ